MDTRTIRFIRKARGISLIKMSKDLGINRNTLSKIECGRIVPKVERLEDILHYLGCSLKIVIDE